MKRYVTVILANPSPPKFSFRQVWLSTSKLVCLQSDGSPEPVIRNQSWFLKSILVGNLTYKGMEIGFLKELKKLREWPESNFFKNYIAEPQTPNAQLWTSDKCEILPTWSWHFYSRLWTIVGY